MAVDEAAGTAVYVPWRTIANTLDALADHMPNRIDKSAFPGQSGAVQGQLLIAFRFLGFIDADGKPLPALQSVAVKDEATRKAAWKKILESKYAALFALNLQKTTPAEFAERMTEAYNVTGDTRLKATRFFLAAEEYVGVPVSPILMRDKTKPIGSGNKAGTRKRRVRRVEDDQDDEEDLSNDDQPPAGESRSVLLKSGGTLTLSATAKFMALSSTDRNFVFGLIDQLEEYEKGNSAE